MRENQDEFLKKLSDLSDIISKDVSRMTGKYLDISNLKFEMYDSRIKNDTMIKVEEFTKRLGKQYDWRDTVQFLAPKNLLMGLSGVLQLSLINIAAAFTFVGHDKIVVGPLTPMQAEGTLKWMLAHELTHVSDDQQYDISEGKYKFLEDWFDVGEKLVAKKHELGFFEGYIEPSKEVKDLEKRMRECMEDGNRYMSVVESHATYIQQRYVEETGMKPSDYLTPQFKAIKTALTPLRVFKAMREKIEQYKKAQKIVEVAYLKGVDIGVLYEHTPTYDEMENPIKYFKRFPKNELLI